MYQLKEALQDLSSRNRQLLQAMGVNTLEPLTPFWVTDEKQSKVQVQLSNSMNHQAFGGNMPRGTQASIPLSIECRDCGTTGPEGGARAFVRGPTPISIVLCSNRLHSEKDYKQVLIHELIHVYDVYIRNWNLHNCEVLAKSEIRAALFGECADERFHVMKRFCVKDRATIATCNMFPDSIGQDCVRKVFEEAMEDNAPFQSDATNKSIKSS
jgi:hypothetical protein